mmetsp:Transcript_5872/g.11207  ORF Transcript_5872/g.11207 Transcript_5872/m.11207 type:complete len:240 (-) Transcript_5872:88-807(-)
MKLAIDAECSARISSKSSRRLLSESRTTFSRSSKSAVRFFFISLNVVCLSFPDSRSNFLATFSSTLSFFLAKSVVRSFLSCFDAELRWPSNPPMKRRCLFTIAASFVFGFSSSGLSCLSSSSSSLPFSLPSFSCLSWSSVLSSVLSSHFSSLSSVFLSCSLPSDFASSVFARFLLSSSVSSSSRALILLRGEPPGTGREKRINCWSGRLALFAGDKLGRGGLFLGSRSMLRILKSISLL